MNKFFCDLPAYLAIFGISIFVIEFIWSLFKKDYRRETGITIFWISIGLAILVWTFLPCGIFLGGGSEDY
jgi:hypothetical protein